MSFARVRALVVVGVLAAAALVFVVVALVKDTQGGDVAVGKCADGAPMATMALPEKPDDVKVKIFNGTERAGLADGVTNEFENRRFQVEKPSESKTKYDGVAILRYGPKTVGNMQLLRAYFLDRAEYKYSADRDNDIVDIVVGEQFQQLATTTEVNQSLVEIGEPELPVGACAAPEDDAAQAR